MAQSDLVLGIDLGGTDCKFGIIDRHGNVVHKEKHPSHSQLGPQEALDLIAEHTRSIAQRYRFGVIGMGVPGPMSSREGIIFEAPNLGHWVNVPVKTILEDMLSIPVLLNNDANAAAYGEFWVGAGREFENMILFTLGTGVGGGIILNGELYTGPDDTAGELGHIIINFEGPLCNCGNRGCLEAYAGAAAMKRIVREAVKAGVKTTVPVPLSEDEYFEAKTVFDAAEAGDEFARKVFHDMGYALGIGAACIINTFNPEVIAYGGAMANAGEYIFKPLRETAMMNSFKKPASRVQIRKAQLGSDAGIIGAAGLALKQTESIG